MPYTADPRVLFAAERTLLAWQRTAIALMGFGFVVERFGLFLEMVEHAPLSRSDRGFSLALGVLLLLLGATVALVSARQFRQVVRHLAPGVAPPGYWTQTGVVLNGGIALIAVLLAVHFLWPGTSRGSTNLFRGSSLHETSACMKGARSLEEFKRACAAGPAPVRQSTSRRRSIPASTPARTQTRAPLPAPRSAGPRSWFVPPFSW